MCATYLASIFLFPFFFAQKVLSPKKNTFASFVSICILSTIFYTIALSIRDLELANRILHVLGGGFLGFFVCFIATRNSGVSINKFQFFVFSALIVLALGIGNELLEFLLQNRFNIISAKTASDTWFDLASNVVGIILAGVCFVPFHKKPALDHI